MHYKLIFWISDCCGCYGLNRLGYEGTSFYLLVSRYFPSSGSSRSAEDRREYWDEGTHQKCSTSVALGPFFHPMIWSLNSVPIRRANSKIKRVPALSSGSKRKECLYWARHLCLIHTPERGTTTTSRHRPKNSFRRSQSFCWAPEASSVSFCLEVAQFLYEWFCLSSATHLRLYVRNMFEIDNVTNLPRTGPSPLPHQVFSSKVLAR